MKIFAIRHGETDYNKDHVLMGSSIDASLNENGRAQVRSLLKDLDTKNISALYASPLKRAEETAEILNTKLNLTIQYRDALKERDVGSFAGKKYTEVQGAFGVDEALDTQDFSVFGGESIQDVEKRVQHVLDEIVTKHKNDTSDVLIITHAGIIKVLYSIMGSPHKQEVENVCVHEFTH